MLRSTTVQGQGFRSSRPDSECTLSSALSQSGGKADKAGINTVSHWRSQIRCHLVAALSRCGTAGCDTALFVLAIPLPSFGFVRTPFLSLKSLCVPAPTPVLFSLFSRDTLPYLRAAVLYVPYVGVPGYLVRRGLIKASMTSLCDPDTTPRSFKKSSCGFLQGAAGSPEQGWLVERRSRVASSLASPSQSVEKLPHRHGRTRYCAAYLMTLDDGVAHGCADWVKPCTPEKERRKKRSLTTRMIDTSLPDLRAPCQRHSACRRLVTRILPAQFSLGSPSPITLSVLWPTSLKRGDSTSAQPPSRVSGSVEHAAM